jgi:hypothetical protein
MNCSNILKVKDIFYSNSNTPGFSNYFWTARSRSALGQGELASCNFFNIILVYGAIPLVSFYFAPGDTDAPTTPPCGEGGWIHYGIENGNEL